MISQIRNQVTKAKIDYADNRHLSVQHPDPPGDCTEGEHERLQNDVIIQCKTVSLACKPQDSNEVLIAKLEQNRRCVSARITVMERCFRGGDKGHRNIVGQTIKTIAQCEHILMYRPVP